MTFEAKINVDPKRIADLLVCAFEGGSNYWYMIVDYIEPPGEVFKSTGDQVFKHCDYPLSEGGGVVIKDIEDDDEDAKTYTLNIETIKRGLAIMSAKYPNHFADFMNENDDAETGDVFLQCCLFGEIVYG